MKKKLLAITVVVLIALAGFIYWSLETEWTKYNPPKTFHIEDKNATYLITVDEETGMYHIEGTNGIPSSNFRTWISKESIDVIDYVGKRVQLDGRFTVSTNSQLLCVPNSELCTDAPHRTGHAAFIITSISEVK